MKKRWLSLLASMVLVLALLTACGGNKATSPKPDSDGTYTSSVFDTENDAGNLTVRYLATKETYQNGDSKVNVGDCTVYTSPEGLVMMIDCSNPAAFPEIDEQLQKMGITKIDIFVMSHPHSDHIGSFVQIAEKYPIGQIYRNPHEYGSGTYQKAMETIERLGIPCTVLRDGDSFDFGQKVHVAVYNPDPETEAAISEQYMEANNASIAMRLTYGDSSFWTSGDMYSPGEDAMVARYGSALQSDIMKMNHHGYDTSNGQALIEAIHPLAAISMHESVTSKTVARRYVASGATDFYTCMDGTVRVRTAGDAVYDVQTQLVRTVTNIYGEPAADGHYVLSRAQQENKK